MTLTVGSISFTGFNADGDDDLAFVALTALPGGTEIHFTDNEWTGAAFNSGESGWTWSTAADIAAGTVVTFAGIGTAGATSNLGSLSFFSSLNFGLSAGNEIVYAYVGAPTAPSTFLAAVTNVSFADGGATLAGTGLTEGVNALNLATVDVGADVAAYNGPRNGAVIFSDYLDDINNASNWLTQDGGGDQSSDGINPDVPFSTAAFTLGDVPQAIAFAPSSASVTVNEGNAGTRAFTFTVERTGGATGEVTFSGTISTGDGLDGADFAAGIVPTVFDGTIPAGAASAVVTVEIAGDMQQENAETFSLTLTTVSNPLANVEVGALAIANATIGNDDVSGNTIGGITILTEAQSLAGTAQTPIATNRIELVRLDDVAPGVGNAEVVSYDAASKQLFILNTAGNTVDIVRIEANGTLAPTSSINLATLADYGAASSVAIKNGIVAVAYASSTAGAAGKVALLDTAGALVKTIDVGVGPDHLTFTPDGMRILVANEAEPVNATNNPAGSISVIDVAGGAAAAAVVQTYGFGALDGNEAALESLGLALFGQGWTPPGGVSASALAASSDIEPEYIAVSPDGRNAYVTLQEVNAVAVLDLTDGSATAPIAILPLGSIDRSLPGNEFDGSDRDGPGNAGKINIANWPVSSLLQPDAITSFQIGGVTYFITANEGDARVGSSQFESEEARLSAVTLDPVTFPDAAAIQDPDGIGRLNVIRHEGDTDGDGDIDQIVTYGGRGISIFRHNEDGTIVKVRETGGEFEKIIADLPNAGTVFNSENTGNFDTRSDNKGPEPEGVSVQSINGRTYAFVSLERVGGVMVYDVTDPANASFVSYEPPVPGAGSPDNAPEVILSISAADSPLGVPLVVTANEVGGATTLYAAITPIYTIQGEGQTSALVGQTVTTVGVVTAVDTNGSRGFYIQDANGDSDARTSDGIFVFTGAAPVVAVGQLVSVTGTVAEFLPNNAASGSLSTTQITATSAAGGIIQSLGTGPLIEAVKIGGVGGLLPPTESLGDGASFFEALEGMLVQVVNPVATGPTNGFGEIYTVVDSDDDLSNGIGGATGLTDRGNLLLMPGNDAFGFTNTAGGDFNPERIQIDDDSGVLAGFTSPLVNVGARLESVTGVVNYDFGNYQVVPTAAYGVVSPGTLTKETTALSGDDRHILIASYNAENLGGTAAASRFTTIADEIVTRLNAPDIIALQEIQDNDGATNSAVTSAAGTLTTLTDAIFTMSGIAYAYLDNPFIGDDTNGGQPGGNIRNAYLYRADRVDFVEGSLATITSEGFASYTTDIQQQVNPDNPFFTSRPPLIAAFTFNGETITFVNNHFTSKGGSGPLLGSQQPPVNGGEVQRAAQAQAVNNFVDSLLAAEADARIVVLGDLNEFPAEEPINVIKGTASISGYDSPANDPFFATATYTEGGTAVLNDLLDTLPPDERFDYVFEGNSQTLDHVLVSQSLTDGAEFDVVRINAEFASQTSDHDPLIARLNVEPETFKLQLLHFSDGEAGLLAGAPSPVASRGTAANLAALVDAFDDDYANTLILAGGDNFLPGPFLNAGTDPSVGLTHNKGTNPGAADIEIHNRIGVEASTIGNHEFDLGTNAFSDAVNDAMFPYLSANLDFSGDSAISGRYLETVGVGGLEEASTLARRIVPSAVVTEGGEKIGLVGATTQILETISSTGGVEVKGFAGDGSEANNVALLAMQLQPVIDDLIAQGVNKIVLMAHLQQIGFEQALAPLLRGVDIILAAGSNTRLGDADDVPVNFPGHAADFANTYPIITAGADGKTTVIVNTDNEYTYLGRLVVDFDANGEIITQSLTDNVFINGAYASTDANVAAAWADGDGDLSDTAFAEGTKGEQVADITEAVQAVIASADGNVFGFTNVYLEGERNIVRNQETNLGNLTADANAYFADQALGEVPFLVSIKNAGGIRAQIGSIDVVTGDKEPPLANEAAAKPVGGISELDIENALRFNNRLMVYDTTPAGLKAILEHGVALLGNQGRFPHVGGVAFSFDPDLPAGARVRDIALLDEDGNSVASLYEDGAAVGGAPGKFSVVTLNFLAQGGDGYPVKANGDNFRYLLDDGTLSDPIDESLDFAAAANVPANTVGEQQALKEFLQEFHGTAETAYEVVDTGQALDQRIQNLNFRDDTVNDAVDASFIFGGFDGDVMPGFTFADDVIDGTGRAGPTTFYVEGNTSGADKITGFGKNDILVLDSILPDGNGDGFITFGRNRLLDLDGPDAGIDTIQFVGGPGRAGLRYLGTDGEGHFVYADGTVRPTGAKEGKLSDDVLVGDNNGSIAETFFFDTALDLSWGSDAIRNFGANDRLVTTSKLFAENDDGRIEFGANGLLDLNGSGLADPTHAADQRDQGIWGQVEITGIGGNVVTALALTGSVETGGVTYFSYMLDQQATSTVFF